MMNRQQSTIFIAGICLLASAFGVSAQPANRNASQNSSQTTAASQAQQPGQSPSELSGQLPPALLEQLALNKEQQTKLDEAQIARRQLWSANRAARQAEYQALAKELDSDKFDPRQIISLRKKTRQAADARMDDVQNAWLSFWDSLNAEQRKLLVSYMKSQHQIQGKAPVPPPVQTPAKSK